MHRSNKPLLWAYFGLWAWNQGSGNMIPSLEMVLRSNASLLLHPMRCLDGLSTLPLL